MRNARNDELSSMTPAQRLAARQPGESWVDAFCEKCGEVQQGLAIGKRFCPMCALNAGEACSGCGCDGANHGGGYSYCCGYPTINLDEQGRPIRY